jgi:hypothetical protein
MRDPQVMWKTPTHPPQHKQDKEEKKQEEQRNLTQDFPPG